jgi:sec-independent protein translocase protein TatB
MLDIGWTELLVIAVVLIVVVGPKDLPPMLRAFGKMTANFRKMAGDFRTQFDEALRESEMDEVRKTISDAQKLNPTNALRDAINPLRQMGQDIKSDLQKATQMPSALEGNPSDMTQTDVEAQQAVEGAEPVSAAPEVPPTVEPSATAKPIATAPSAAVAVAESKPVPVAAPATAAVSAVQSEPAKAVPAKPRAPRKAVAKGDEPAVAADTPATAKQRRARAEAKPASTTAEAAPKAPARKRTTKKTDTPKDDA